MKKLVFILIACLALTGCNEIKANKPEDNSKIYEKIDAKLKENNIEFSKVEINKDNYYALEAWQYNINNASCIVDIYRYNIETDFYKEAVEMGALRSKEYEGQYIVATVTNGIGAIIWSGCDKEDQINSILGELK